MATCHGCSESFGFLTKELGCPNCGFSYCKKCLKYKLTDEEAKELAKTNPKSAIKKGALVCRECHDLSTGKSKLKSPFKDAASLIRTLHRLESLENPSCKPPITLYREAPASRFNELKTGMSEADQKIVERLEELRSDITKNRRKSDQSEVDVEARLARLRGEDPDAKSESSKEILLKQKPETEADLLNRLGKEAKLDKEYNTSLVGDIEGRLAKLRPSPAAAAGTSEVPSHYNSELDSIISSSDDEGLTEQEQVDKLIKKFTAEVELEAKLGEGGNKSTTDDAEPMETEPAISDESSEDDNEDKYCQVCNEARATLKCKSCENDVFCKKCFHEFHVEIGELHKPTQV